MKISRIYAWTSCQEEGKQAGGARVLGAHHPHGHGEWARGDRTERAAHGVQALGQVLEHFVQAKVVELVQHVIFRFLPRSEQNVVEHSGVEEEGALRQ